MKITSDESMRLPIEGYILFEGDTTSYEFTPDADFVYSDAVH